MGAAIAEHGWDGRWFRRAYDFFGEPVGSSTNAEGQIFVEPQGICVMGGAGADGRAERALDSVRAKLATPHGIVLNQPPYTRYHLELGEISSYPPGYKENGSVFCHTNPWVMIAETLVDDGDAAFDYYKRINPSSREAISEVHRAEPDVYVQTIAGPDGATFGEAKNSWLTGTAAWNFVAISQWILGSARSRRPAGRPRPAGGLGRLRRRAGLPGRHLPYQGMQGPRRGEMPGRLPDGRGQTGRRQPGAPGTGGGNGRRGSVHHVAAPG